MLEELTAALEDYQTKWATFIADRSNKEFFASLRPTSVAWKTTDLAEFDKLFAELKDQSDQIHLGWINERWLASLHLRDASLPGGVTLIKLMQRRPGSSDAVGLDHVDFIIPPNSSAKAVAEKEDMKWTEEKNGLHCKWLSVWFEGTEAKLRSETVFRVCADELVHIEKQILA
ncbi:MAG TPA: hypothetical protein VK694_03885 [Verrucomicrobiae bacterium]|nr:hypothetical protein [Verrucomicrobiae bacterium]